MRRYDIFAIDLDGTLIGPRGRVSPANYAAVQRAASDGMLIVVCTGRGFVESASILAPLNLAGPVVVAGGAMVVDAPSGATLSRSTMESGVVRRVAERLNAATGHYVLLLKDRTVTGFDYLLVGAGKIDDASKWWFEQVPVLVERGGSPQDDPWPEETIRVGVVTTAREIKGLSEAIRAEFADQVLLHHFPIITSDGAGVHSKRRDIHLLEVFHPDTSKWTALSRIAAELGIDAARIAAIGDEVNDLEMIHRAGLGIAMGNAQPSIMHVADRVTESHAEDGVARAIDRILAGEW